MTKRIAFIVAAIVAVAVGFLMITMRNRPSLPPPVVLTVQIIEDGVKEQWLRSNVIDLFMLLNESSSSVSHTQYAGYQREIVITQTARRVFAAYERQQNRWGFASVLEVQPIVAEVLRRAKETISRSLKNEPGAKKLRKANWLTAGYYRQVAAAKPITRAD